MREKADIRQTEVKGLVMRRTAVVTCADDRKDERPVVGPVTVRVAGGEMNTDAIVVPPFADVLVGQIVLEFLDLIADCRRRTLEPRMPDYPLLDMK